MYAHERAPVSFTFESPGAVHMLMAVSGAIYLMAFFLLYYGYVGGAWASAIMGSISLGYSFAYVESEDMPGEDILESEAGDEYEIIEDDDELEEEIEEIERLFEEYLESEKEDMKSVVESYALSSVKICPICGAEFEYTSRICPKCSAELKPEGDLTNSLLIPGTKTFFLNAENGMVVMVDEKGEDVRLWL